MSDNAYLINAITGEKISTDVKYFISLDEFREYVSQKWNIPQEQLLILLPFGNKLKNSAFKECLRTNTLSETEFYIYDRRLFSIMNEPVGTQDSEHSEDDRAGLTARAALLVTNMVNNAMSSRESSLLKPISSPLADADLKIDSLTSRVITSLLTTNLGWLSALEIDVHYFKVLIEENVEQTSEILKCLSICEQYLKLYCYDVEKLYNSNVDFLNQLSQNGQNCKWQLCYNDILSKLDGGNGSLSQYVDLQVLEENERTLRLLDKTVNSELKKVKKELDLNSDFRSQISENIQLVRKDYDPESMKDKLEKTMLEKFDELVNEVRMRSREILDQDISNSPEEFLDEVRSFLLNVKNEITSKLFTIAQALYAQIERVLERKTALQTKAVLFFGQIAFVQMQEIGIKRNLLTECSKNLNEYQEKELQFAQVEDIPLIYGLFLIERYRRDSWSLQVLSQTKVIGHDFKLMKKKERDYQAEWAENFGDTASLFCRDLSSIPGFGNLDVVTFIDSLSLQAISDEQLSTLQASLSESLKEVNHYISQLSQVGVADDVSELLLRNLSEAQNYRISALQSQTTPELSSSVKDQVKGYRTRIKKLESLLHEARYSVPGHWPSGILNPVHVTPFHNNVTTVGPKGSPSSSTLFEPIHGLNIMKALEMENDYRDLQNKLAKLQSTLEHKEHLLADANRNISDLEVEVMAFKESMSHLNGGLARLSEKEEKNRKQAISQQNEFKSQVFSLAKENASALKELNSLREKLEQYEASEQKASDRIKNLEEKIEEERNISQKKVSTLEGELSGLQTRIKEIESENEELKVKLRDQDQETSNSKDELTKITSTEIIENSKHTETFTELQRFGIDVEGLIFDVFASDVFILENIGLLLSLDDQDNAVIRRVKGLRRVQSQGVLDESIQITEGDMDVKSTVYKEIRNIHETLKSTDNMEKHKELLFKLKMLYENKLYESAVIRRFKDIETLAKKLTKENKKKRALLESYQNERVTLRDFQVGDLALFLPTRENKSPSESSVSSLNSSFSSVDLSTPPPFEPTTLHPSSAGKDKAKLSSKVHPWAAFTAFENNTRYFLRDDEEITRGKDWFVGRISTMESFRAEDGNNPYKLNKGSLWFQVTATMVSCPG